MADPTDPWGDAWDTFFQTHALPLAEELAFRQYLAHLHVPDEASIQDLTAYYDQFRAQWDPEEPQGA
jgi:hypothetical protein